MTSSISSHDCSLEEAEAEKAHDFSKSLNSTVYLFCDHLAGPSNIICYSDDAQIHVTEKICWVAIIMNALF